MYDLQTSCLTRLTKMAAALTLLFIGCLLQDVMCGDPTEKVIMPQAIEALRGSCVTIPCSFEVRREFNVHLDQTCKALWKKANTVVFNSRNPQSSTIKGNFTGNLTNKDCTTTLNNMQPAHNNYFLRVECDNTLKHDMIHQNLQISVRDDPPTPTLTPPTVRVMEGTSVSVRCSAPAPCLSLPPALTWTPHLGDSHETLQDNQDKTKVKISTLTFTASHLHHRQNISCSAVYTKQDGSTESSATKSLTADISYSPKHTSVSVSPSGPVPEDSTVTLTCRTTANPAVVTYTWYRTDGDQETFIGTGHVLSITASEVRGPFFCKAENNLGAGRSNISHIDVQYSPKHTSVSVSPSGPVPEDSTVTLTCSTTANPAVVNYTWYRTDGGQETFIGTGHVLSITASKVRGPFFCKAENNVGAGRSNISHIDVQYSPKHTSVSVSPSGPVPENSTVTLTCRTTANPAVVNYTWYRTDGGQETFIGTGHVLSITASEVRGPFVCKAENNVGAGRSNISHIDVQYSPKHTSVSVSPSGPVPKNSTVTLTCSTTANPAVVNYTWYRTDGDQETFIGTGHVLSITASEVRGPFFCKAENDVGAGRSNISHIDVQFAPQILPSSYCNKTAEQLNCSCETVGNPSPTSQWYLDGLPVNHSDKFAISSESVKDTGVRSIISVNRPQWKGLSTLSCLSSNSQGSVRQPFYVYVLEPQTSADSHDKVTLYVFITIVAALLVLVCALLLVIRSQRIHHNLPQNTVAMNQLLTSGEGNEIPNATEEDIYANVQRQGDVAYCAAISEVNSPNFPSSGSNNVEGVNTSSEKKEEGSGAIYSSVNWKSKSKRRKEEVAGDMDQPGSSYLAEERCMLGGTCRSFMSNAMEMGNLYDEAQPRNVNKGMECEYAQVKFKSKSVKK
uniref:sialoadhesin-like n=1 Tax=Scatophagus argus TaxID=75038 RepID=UPI001ED7FB13|nr:sialoadhesin-like [Scatophagus argus]